METLKKYLFEEKDEKNRTVRSPVPAVLVEDVLREIKIRLKQIERAYRQNSCSKQQYYWDKNEFEEIKSSLEG